MKDELIRKRASNALKDTPYNVQNAPAIVALINYAAQAPGLDFANYSDPISFRQEARAIFFDWKKVKGALHECAQLGVTNQMVIEAAPRAFSGRLQWFAAGQVKHEPAMQSINHEAHWDYTTGQYWPTEYRKAAFAVLEGACSALRQSRPPKVAMPTTIAELKQLSRDNGSHWFDTASMRFFGTKIESKILRGRYFITSEKERNNPLHTRKFTIRQFDSRGNVNTVGEFHAHHTKAEAVEALREHIMGWREKAAS